MFEFIEAHRGEFYLDVMCRMLGVTRAGYFSWRGRPISKRKTVDEQLGEEIEAIHGQSKGRYGVPRIHAELKARGFLCSRRRVARLMRELGLRGKSRRKYKVTTKAAPGRQPVPDLVGRRFQVQKPNTVWAGDISYLPTKEGWLYLAVMMDLHSRRVVGWAMGERFTTDLTLAALQMGVDRRQPPPGLIHHSDRGSQYSSHLYQQTLAEQNIRGSMGRKGDCFDNAVVESFFSTLKRELLLGQVFESRQEARTQVFEFIEVFYNRQRRHSTLGYRSPLEFEQINQGVAA